MVAPARPVPRRAVNAPRPVQAAYKSVGAPPAVKLEFVETPTPSKWRRVDNPFMTPPATSCRRSDDESSERSGHSSGVDGTDALLAALTTLAESFSTSVEGVLQKLRHQPGLRSLLPYHTDTDIELLETFFAYAPQTAPPVAAPAAVLAAPPVAAPAATGGVLAAPVTSDAPPGCDAGWSCAHEDHAAADAAMLEEWGADDDAMMQAFFDGDDGLEDGTVDEASIPYIARMHHIYIKHALFRCGWITISI